MITDRNWAVVVGFGKKTLWTFWNAQLGKADKAASRPGYPVHCDWPIVDLLHQKSKVSDSRTANYDAC